MPITQTPGPVHADDGRLLGEEVTQIKATKVCTGPLCRGAARPLEDFNWKSKAKGTRQARCRACMKKYLNETWYPANKDRHIANVAERNARQTQTLNALRGRWKATKRCEICNSGEDLWVVAKKGTRPLAALIRGADSEAFVTKALEAANVLCATCSGRVHGRMSGTVRLLQHRGESITPELIDALFAEAYAALCTKPGRGGR